MNYRHIGKLVKAKTCWYVCCAACGKRKQAVSLDAYERAVGRTRSEVIHSLRTVLFWSNAIDGRWRCDTCHANLAKLMDKIQTRAMK